MIVRDEEDNVERCFNSVARLIDAYAIVDTGSQDKTIAKVRSFMKKHRIPGEIISRPWINFGASRTEALRHAEDIIHKLDPGQKSAWYALFIDADDQAVGIKLNKSSLIRDQYLVETRSQSISYPNVRLARLKPDNQWVWREPRHEYIAPLGEWMPSKGEIRGGYILRGCQGLRSRNKHTSLEDAFELLKQFSDEPENSRAIFYAAQSFRDAGYHDLASVLYRRRAEMGGWPQEIYISLLYLGAGNFSTGDHSSDTVNLLLRAFELCPHRLEAPLYLLRIWRFLNQPHVAWNFAKPLIDIQAPGDALFLDREIHEWAFFEEAGLCAYYAGDRVSFKTLLQRALKAKSIPQDAADRTRKNLKDFG